MASMSEQPFAGYLAAKEAEIRAGLVAQLRELAQSTVRLNPDARDGATGFLPGFLHGLRIAGCIASGHPIEPPSTGPGATETATLAVGATPAQNGPQNGACAQEAQR